MVRLDYHYHQQVHEPQPMRRVDAAVLASHRRNQYDSELLSHANLLELTHRYLENPAHQYRPDRPQPLPQVSKWSPQSDQARRVSNVASQLAKAALNSRPGDGPNTPPPIPVSTSVTIGVPSDASTRHLSPSSIMAVTGTPASRAWSDDSYSHL
jgi:hypothetical protein